MSESLKKLRYKTATDIIIERDERVNDLTTAVRAALVEWDNGVHDAQAAADGDLIKAMENLRRVSAVDS